MKNVCTVKTIDNLIAALQGFKAILGGDAAVIMSQDEEGNSYGDILMFAEDTAKDMAADDCYRGYYEDPAVKADSKNQNVLIIFPNM